MTLALCLSAAPAFAADSIKATIGQRGNWDTAIIHLGTKAGIFARHNLEIEPVYTSGSGETLQPVISGSVDLGFAVGTLGAMAAYAKGAPVRIVGAQATGAADYWYAKTSSPIKTLKDTNDKTIAFSTRGSSTNSIVLAFIKEFDLKAKPTPTGNPSSTLTAVMTDQVDVGWASPPFGLKEIDAGQIRVVARRPTHDREGPDHPRRGGERGCAGQAQGRDRALHAGLSRGDRLHVFGQSAGDEGLCRVRRRPGALARRVRDDFFPKSLVWPDEIKGLDTLMPEAVSLKFIAEPLTAAQLGRADSDPGQQEIEQRQDHLPFAEQEREALCRVPSCRDRNDHTGALR